LVSVDFDSCCKKVYTTLDYESRYFGKEVVGLVANRFGKSVSALGLAIVSMKYTGTTDIESFDTKTAPQLLIVATIIWLYVSILASNQIDTSRRVGEKKDL
jgi:ATP/ADP translocase